MTVENTLIGARIRERRKALNYTQESLSEKMDCSKNHISGIERGIYVPTTHFLMKLCDVLGGTPDYYLLGEECKETDELVNLVRSLPTDERALAARIIKDIINYHRLK